MAISNFIPPKRYMPSDNPVIWNVNSDNPNIVAFRFKILTKNNDIIQVMDFACRPDYPNGIVADISRVLRNLVFPEVSVNRDNLVEAVSLPLFTYTTRISEITIEQGIKKINDEEALEMGPWFVWLSWLDSVSYTSYSYPSYVITGDYIARFLTNAPMRKRVNFNSTNEYLYFIQETNYDLQLNIKTFDSKGEVNNYFLRIEKDKENPMMRLSVSPQYLQDYGLVDFTGITHYSVRIIVEKDKMLTEERTYVFVEQPCAKELVNLAWVNNLGGIDSYTFYNPQVKYEISKASIQKNPSRNTADMQAYISNGLFNPDSEIYSRRTSTTYTATSGELTDEESRWLLELFQSRQVWVEMNSYGHYYAPVKINTSNYNSPRNRYTREGLNTIDIEFTMTDGIQPGLTI